MKMREVKVGPHSSSRTEEIILRLVTALTYIGKAKNIKIKNNKNFNYINAELISFSKFRIPLCTCVPHGGTHNLLLSSST